MRRRFVWQSPRCTRDRSLARAYSIADRRSPPNRRRNGSHKVIWFCRPRFHTRVAQFIAGSQEPTSVKSLPQQPGWSSTSWLAALQSVGGPLRLVGGRMANEAQTGGTALQGLGRRRTAMPPRPVRARPATCWDGTPATPIEIMAQDLESAMGVAERGHAAFPGRAGRDRRLSRGRDTEAGGSPDQRVGSSSCWRWSSAGSTRIASRLRTYATVGVGGRASPRGCIRSLPCKHRCRRPIPSSCAS